MRQGQGTNDAPCNDPGSHVVHAALQQISGLVHAIHEGKFVLGGNLPHRPGKIRHANFALHHTHAHAKREATTSVYVALTNSHCTSSPGLAVARGGPRLRLERSLLHPANISAVVRRRFSTKETCKQSGERTMTTPKTFGSSFRWTMSSWKN